MNKENQDFVYILEDAIHHFLMKQNNFGDREWWGSDYIFHKETFDEFMEYILKHLE